MKVCVCVCVCVKPSQLLLEDTLLSLQSTQGLALWAAVKARWAIRCEARF